MHYTNQQLQPSHGKIHFVLFILALTSTYWKWFFEPFYDKFGSIMFFYWFEYPTLNYKAID